MRQPSIGRATSASSFRWMSHTSLSRLDRPIPGEVRPVTPILAVLAPAVLRVIDLHEPLRLPPDRLEDPRPGVADADVSGPPASGFDHATLFVVDHRVNPED